MKFITPEFPNRSRIWQFGSKPRVDPEFSFFVKILQFTNVFCSKLHKLETIFNLKSLNNVEILPNCDCELILKNQNQ